MHSVSEPKQYDFIIVGGGSAGCAIANRLSEIGDWEILLIERGRPPNAFSKVPIFAPALHFTDYTERLHMEYQKDFGWGLHVSKLSVKDNFCP